MNARTRTPLDVAQAAIALLFLAALLFAGGSSRADVPQLIAVRLTAILAIGVVVVFADAASLRRNLRPVSILLVAAAIMIIQLIPLPPGVWLNLPGRSFYAGVTNVTGQAQPWRPLTLSPDLTLESLLGLLPPLAVILLGMRMPRSWISLFPVVILCIAAASAVLAIFQLAGGPESPLRLYPVVDTDSGVGFFGNRNHQALLMSMGIPTAIWWGLTDHGSPQTRLLRGVIAGLATLLFVLGAIVTSSRAGIILCAVAILAGAAATLPVVLDRLGRRGVLGLVAAIGVACLAGSFVLPYDRLGLELGNDPRLDYWGNTLHMIQAFFPLGSGAGTFVRVFPRFETIGMLRPEYVNHAHNDFLELLSDSGIAGAVLIGMLVVGFARACAAAAGRSQGTGELAAARLALVLVFLALLASLVDYPLRAPLIGAIVAFACVVVYRVFEPPRFA